MARKRFPAIRFFFFPTALRGTLPVQVSAKMAENPPTWMWHPFHTALRGTLPFQVPAKTPENPRTWRGKEAVVSDTDDENPVITFYRDFQPPRDRWKSQENVLVRLSPPPARRHRNTLPIFKTTLEFSQRNRTESRYLLLPLFINV